MALTLIQGKEMHDAFKVLSPAYMILDQDKPNSLSHAIKMPPPVISTINNWMTEGDKELMRYYNEINSNPK